MRCPTQLRYIRTPEHYREISRAPELATRSTALVCTATHRAVFSSAFPLVSCLRTPRDLGAKKLTGIASVPGLQLTPHTDLTECFKTLMWPRGNMPGIRSSAWHQGVLVTAALLVVMTAVVVQGAGHRHQPLSLNTRLNMLVDQVDSSIWEKQQLLGGSHSYMSNENDLNEDGVTIVEEQEANPEDMHDYVNNAPWTRNRQRNQPMIIDMQMIRLAEENAQRVKVNGNCGVPQQKCDVVRSSQHPPDTLFQPRCALLHRCSEDSGCCLSDDDVCGPAETEKVQLYFYAFGDMRVRIEAMTFLNHTRCACQSRYVVPSCKCPRYFTPTHVDGQCVCDCDKGPKCRRYKKGRRYFSPTDVRCVSNGDCVEPNCEYGPFLTLQRRCTKRRERERYTTTRK